MPLHGEILTQLRDLALTMSRTPAPETVDLLTRTIWGTPGGTRYKHLDTPEKIRELQDAFFLELWKAEQMLGTLAFVHRTSPLPARDLHTFYIRYFAMRENLQRKIDTRSQGNSTGVRSNSIMKRAAKRLLDRPEPFLKATGSDHAVFYAYVELENERSMNMVRMMGFEPVGKFSTLVFSRYSPRADKAVHRARPEDQSAVLAHLTAQYAGHAFYSPQNIFFRNQYFVLEENGEIVAGLQANPTHWVMEGMPGCSGQIIMHVVPHLPFISRLFHPRKFHFLAVEGMFCPEGREDLLYRLLGHACEAMGMNAALMWLDTRDGLLKRMRSAGRLGLMQRINSDTRVDIVVKWSGLSAAEVAQLKARPVYISAFDVT
ncbi:MAG: hypothetical protein AAF570_19615 [Bacteroidota bacterium]